MEMVDGYVKESNDSTPATNDDKDPPTTGHQEMAYTLEVNTLMLN